MNPTVPAKSMVADLNVDMFLPLYPFRILTVYGLDESTLGADAKAVGSGDGESRCNPIPSRCATFYAERSVQLHPAGYAERNGGYRERERLEGRTDREGLAGDAVSRAVGRCESADRQGRGGEVQRFGDALVLRVANESKRPEWNKDRSSGALRTDNASTTMMLLILFVAAALGGAANALAGGGTFPGFSRIASGGGGSD
jgi:hypothetical protein